MLDDFEIGRLLWDRKERFFHLLLAWGLDILRVTPHAILDTYDPALFDRYEAAGGDLTRGHTLAEALGAHGTNKPGYGWAKHRATQPRIARELAIALDGAVRRGSERTVALLLWAGAIRTGGSCIDFDTPRRFAAAEEPDDEDDGNPVETAVIWGNPKLLARLKPDPARDNFAALWTNVQDPDCAALLAAKALPADWSLTLIRNVHRAVSEYCDRWQARRCLERLFKDFGARLTAADERELGSLRRDILRAKDDLAMFGGCSKRSGVLSTATPRSSNRSSGRPGCGRGATSCTSRRIPHPAPREKARVRRSDSVATRGTSPRSGARPRGGDSDPRAWTAAFRATHARMESGRPPVRRPVATGVATAEASVAGTAPTSSSSERRAHPD